LFSEGSPTGSFQIRGHSQKAVMLSASSSLGESEGGGRIVLVLVDQRDFTVDILRFLHMPAMNARTVTNALREMCL
jgi:hypothetical protein